MKKTRIGIAGYGNLGRSAEIGVRQFPDLELAVVLTRRDPSAIERITPGVRVLALDQAPALAGQIDVMLLCGGSMSDLPEQGPWLAGLFNTVDGYDTHARIPEYFAAMDQAGRSAGKISVVAAGWDPGLLSLQRLLGQAFLPQGSDETFWGKGVSQGHSDAIRRVPGVRDARQYTVPRDEAVERVRQGLAKGLTPADKHYRECFVVAEPDADLARIETDIKSMPNYFADYETIVHFISAAELAREHQGLPHSGLMLRTGQSGQQQEHRHQLAYSMTLDSNPDFTAHVLLACARAAWRMAGEGQTGARTLFDIPPAYLSSMSSGQLRKHLL
ncbi:MAG: diaminopimelate dehydrogenase [Clostridiaceae bacterium]|nr:diaminopimelate dehydrogenase [Clostridiaceae bacterium]